MGAVLDYWFHKEVHKIGVTSIFNENHCIYNQS